MDRRIFSWFHARFRQLKTSIVKLSRNSLHALSFANSKIELKIQNVNTSCIPRVFSLSWMNKQSSFIIHAGMERCLTIKIPLHVIFVTQPHIPHSSTNERQHSKFWIFSVSYDKLENFPSTSKVYDMKFSWESLSTPRSRIPFASLLSWGARINFTVLNIQLCEYEGIPRSCSVFLSLFFLLLDAKLESLLFIFILISNDDVLAHLCWLPLKSFLATVLSLKFWIFHRLPSSARPTISSWMKFLSKRWREKVERARLIHLQGIRVPGTLASSWRKQSRKKREIEPFVISSQKCFYSSKMINFIVEVEESWREPILCSQFNIYECSFGVFNDARLFRGEGWKNRSSDADSIKSMFCVVLAEVDL